MATSFVNQALILALKALLNNNPVAVKEINKYIVELDKISVLNQDDEGIFMDDSIDPFEAEQISTRLKNLIGMELDNLFDK